MKQLIVIVLLVLAYVFIKNWIRDNLAVGRGRERGHAPSGRNKGGRTPDAVEDMVQDPNCGAYLPESRSVTAKHDGRTLHFCSEECAREYARKQTSGH